MSTELKLIFGQCSETGPKDDNEDTLATHVPSGSLMTSRGAVALIADGMSGGFGKTASQAVARGFLSDYFSTPESWTVQTAGQRVLGALNSWLYSQAAQSSQPLATTFSAIVFKSGSVHLFHVGDSRIYRLRDGVLEQLTHDHRVTMAGGRSYLNRAMGIEHILSADYRDLTVEEGDRFLLSSDGIHDFLDEKAIVACLGDDAQNSADALVAASLEAGGSDNSSALVIDVEQLPLASADEYYRSLTELPFPPELDPGMEFDGFRILREIHASKRSQLYLAEDIESGDQVVLKTPSVNFEDDPVYIEQFILEEWVGRRINNPRVLKICAPQRKLNFLYHVTEHVDGQTLREWIGTHHRPPVEDVQNIVRQIARGLQAFHRQEMVHRDLKPENIMLDSQGQVKLIDFGSTYIAGMDEVAVPLKRNHLVGTENYTAPEFHHGHVGTPAADIYSLGVLAYEMFTGQLPYGDKVPEKVGSCRVRYESAMHSNPMVPMWIDGALGKAVRCDPRDRYGLLSEFVQDLTHPNSQFMRTTPLPLLERDPARVWQGIAGVMFVLNVWLLYSLM